MWLNFSIGIIRKMEKNLRIKPKLSRQIHCKRVTTEYTQPPQDSCLQSFSSVSTIQSVEEGYWRSATKLILRFERRIKITKFTLYLAISYLWRYVRLGRTLNEDNYEKISLAVILLSAKMNEIYSPKISSLIKRCSNRICKEEVVGAEQSILELFDFDLSFSEISLFYLWRTMGQEKACLLEAEKMLSFVVTEKDLMKLGEQTIALSIIYLVNPQMMLRLKHNNLRYIKSTSDMIHRRQGLSKPRF